MPRIARLLPFIMPNEPTPTDLDWTQLQGTVLEGGYQLESILAADERYAAFKVRVLGDSGANAFAKLFIMDAADAQDQAALWQRARHLKNTNLLTPLGAGETTIDGSSLAYVVLTRPDEKLDEILRERPLDREETRECLRWVIGGLEELHAAGLVHGCLAPEHILSVGESIKLSTECVRSAGAPPPLKVMHSRYTAPESGGENVTPEADIWCFGATLIEIMTQQPCREDGLAQADSLPAPFNMVARQCLDPDPAVRPKPGRIEALVRSQAAAPEPKKPQAAAAAAGVGRHQGTASSAPASAPAPFPRRAALAPRSAAPAKTVVDVEKPKQRALWPYMAAGIVFALVLIWWLWPKHRAPAAMAPVAAQSAASPKQGTAWESKTIPPENAKPAPQAAAPQPLPASKGTESLNGQPWRVVIYAYTREADAANKARAVNAKHPDLQAEAFSPSGNSPYLVVVGGRLSREDANRLLHRVRGMGLPRDAYIQNYDR